VRTFSGSVARAPVGHCGLIAALLDLDQLVQVVVSETDGMELRYKLTQLSMPGALEFVTEKSTGVGSRSLLAGKSAIEGKSTAYVCVGQVCSAPIHEAQTFQERLKQARIKGPATG
jgi:uncharacterized protein YyaL (SSP411 family)